MDTLKEQFNDYTENGILPLFELEMVDGDWLIVNLSADDKGIVFDFDQDGKDVWFDGEVEQLGEGRYLYPFCDWFDLDSHLAEVLANIQDGFLSPNSLFPLGE